MERVRDERLDLAGLIWSLFAGLSPYWMRRVFVLSISAVLCYRAGPDTLDRTLPFDAGFGLDDDATKERMSNGKTVTGIQKGGDCMAFRAGIRVTGLN